MASSDMAEGADSMLRRSPCDVQQRMQKSFGQGFHKLGLLIGRKPKAMLALNLVIGLAVCSFLMLAERETRIEYVYVPRHAGSFDHFELTQSLFGNFPRTSSAILYAADGGSVLRPEFLAWAWKTYATLLYVRSPEENVSFSDICHRHSFTKKCNMASLFQFLPAADLADSGVFNASGAPPSFQNATAVVRDLQRKNTIGLDVVLSADHKALRFVFPETQPQILDRGIFAVRDNKVIRILAWEDAYLKEVERLKARKGEIGQVTGIAYRSIDDEVSANMTGAIPFLVAAINLIFIFLAVLLGGRPCRRSRLMLALAAVGVIQFAEIAGFALTAACQVPLTDLSLLLVFLAVGVGVDDIIVLTDAFDQADSSLPEHERLACAFEHAGRAVFLTSVTNLTAFLVASTSDFPAISWFCVSAGFVVFCLFFFTLTIYAPLLVLDERRRVSGRVDCFLCCLLPAKIKPSEEGVASASSAGSGRFRSTLKRIILPLTSQPLPALACIVVLLGMASAGVWCVSNPDTYKVGIPLSGAFPDGSYLTEYLDEILPRYFGGMPDTMSIVLQDVNLDNNVTQEKALALQRAFSKIPQAVGNASFFLLSLQEWETCTKQGLAIRTEAFPMKLRKFLQAPSFQKCSNKTFGVPQTIHPISYWDSVAWSGDGLQVKAVKMKLPWAVSTTVQGRIDDLKFIRNVFSSGGLKGYPFAPVFLYAERDIMMWELIGSTLIYAGVSVTCVVAVFVHPLGTFLVALAIFNIDFTLLGLMALWDIPVDAMSFICLAMAAGMSVDYVVHLAHAALTRMGQLPNEACSMAEILSYALDTTGASVLKGAASTFLGICLLSIAPNMIFRIFFKMLCGIVVLGLLSGFILFPSGMTLCLFVRRSLSRSFNKAPYNAPTKKSEDEVVDVQPVVKNASSDIAVEDA